MNEKEVKRKLAAILSADVKEYSRLMEEDEIATVRTVEEYRGVISGFIEKHSGRVVDSPGDNLLAEFGSMVDAVECAVEIQKELGVRNADIPEKRRMEFRIGVNLGDVIEESGRLYGDGINVAARIEGLAEPGGICISRTAYDQIKKKLDLGYRFLGEHTVKNISEPVPVYRVLTEPEAAGKVIGEKRFLGNISRRAAIAAIIILVIIAAGLFSWIIFSHQSRKVEAASLDRMAYPLPEKPSIAVLPFDNLSGDPDQEYFSDGLTEEIITGLSKVPELFVIARNSSFTYKGKPVKVQQVSEELGVRYVLEGSVRKEGNRVRITAQLIDAIKGYHVWSERYDRELKDILALQEDIMSKIMLEIEVKLTEGEQVRYWAKSKKKGFDLEYWQKWKLMIWHNNRAATGDHEIARKLANELIEMDPTRAEGYAQLGWLHLSSIIVGKSQSPPKSIMLAEEYAQKALQLDESAARARELMGWVHVFKGKHDLAIAEMEKWVAGEPNGAHAHFNLGSMFLRAGRREDAIRQIETAIRLDPFPFNWSYSFLAEAYAGFFLPEGPKDLDKAEELCKKALNMNPIDFVAHKVLILIYSYQNRMEEARAQASELLKVRPKFSTNREALPPLLKDKDKEAYKRNVELFRKAGLPE